MSEVVNEEVIGRSDERELRPAEPMSRTDVVNSRNERSGYAFDRVFEHSLRESSPVAVTCAQVTDKGAVLYEGIVESYDENYVTLYHKEFTNKGFAVIDRDYIVMVASKANLMDVKTD